MHPTLRGGNCGNTIDHRITTIRLNHRDGEIGGVNVELRLDFDVRRFKGLEQQAPRWQIPGQRHYRAAVQKVERNSFAIVSGSHFPELRLAYC